jgi:F-type H+-transporting ATPase subunit alpha
MELKEQIFSILKERIDQYKIKSTVEEVGTVIDCGDGIARVRGLPSAMAGEVVRFPNDIFGLVFNLEKEELVVVILENHTKVKEGDQVRRTGNIMGVVCGKEMLGRVVTPLGDPLDDKGPINAAKVYPLERMAPGVIDRTPVVVPLQTGYKMIDSMIPIGRGQRELIIGDRQTGKSTLAIDTIINQKGKDVICVYVAIGQKESTVVELVHKLEVFGAMDYTIVVEASASSPATLQYLAPFAGCAIAEEFMFEQHKDVLIIYDDLTKHAAAYRHISLLLRRPPGREAYPGDVFYLHSRLLERSAKLNPELGGGSLTALPIIETQNNDISAYIPTNVISITDGQIFLEADLFHAGIRPAVNVGVSVSRVGGSAQIKAMRQVSGRLRLDLAQYREKESFALFSSDLDKETLQQLKKGQLMVELLKQEKHVPLPIVDQVIMIFAGLSGQLDDLPLEKVKKFEKEFLRFINSYPVPLREKIGSKDGLTEELNKELCKALTSFIETFGVA